MPKTIPVPDVGAAMPDLTLVDAAGEQSSLQDLVAGSPAVVYFMRTSHCSVCVKHARDLAELAERDALGGARVVLLAPGGAEEAREVAKLVPSSQVTPRASGTGHADAGLGSFLRVQHSGTFVLDTDGSILYRRTVFLPPKSFSRAEVLDALLARQG